MFRLLYKFKGFAVLSVISIISFSVINHQKTMIKYKNNVINDLKGHEVSYKKTINRMRYNQRKANKVFKEYNDRQNKINSYFDNLKSRLNESNEKTHWDDKEVPDSIVCFINCMQRANRQEKCECP